ncbi:MAG TPA: DNA-formamidopyrimidine glycosylase family protein [Candidatus Limnocylindrales bacterium]|nr:DNA-formamidopyrimidine glycosylase family protein [Candidatus Limnocylindrales bacterium]
MAEGDTLARIAVGLRPHLAGRVVVSARARLPGPQVSRVVGQKIEAVEAVGKNLLIRFENGLEIRTHLGLHGSWHRYRPGEPWRRPASRAVLIIEVQNAVAVCFDAPVVELFETRTEPVHPTLGQLGPDLLDPKFDAKEAHRRVRAPERANQQIGDVLLDQRAMAGVGNVYKSEVLFLEKVNPFEPVSAVDDDAIDRIIETSRRLLVDNARPGGPAGRTTTTDPKTGTMLAPTRLWVYDRAGRPCHRCGTILESAPQGTEVPRTTYWCPSCQAPNNGRGATKAPKRPTSKAAAKG